MVAFASLFTWVITVAQVPQTVSQILSGSIHNKYMMLLVINIILLIAGTFIDTTSALVIFTPLFLPLVQAMGIDLIHFGLSWQSTLPSACARRRWALTCLLQALLLKSV